MAVVFVGVAAPAFGQTQDAHTLVAEANRAFAAGDFEAALAGYRSAEVSEPESPELAYNQGAAHYKLGDYEAARSAFNRALLTRDLALEAKIKFNLGDVAYSSALEKQSNLEEAIELLKTGIGRYRDALELDPKDQDARTNIELAQLLIKDLLDKQKKEQEEQEQQQQDKQDDQDQKQEEGDENQKQEGQEGDEKEQEDEQKQQDDQQQGDKQDEQEQSGDQQEQQEEKQQQQQQPSDEMSTDEAERMLQAVRDKEKQRRDEQAQRRRARYVRPPKDW